MKYMAFPEINVRMQCINAVCLNQDCGLTFEDFPVGRLDPNSALSTCFAGFENQFCAPIEGIETIDPDRLFLWNNLAILYGSATYCLGCCSNTRPYLEISDAWNLVCKREGAKARTDYNVYNWEFGACMLVCFYLNSIHMKKY